MKNKLSTKQGFTIIEVVLVLAIAGLIFLMVFVAFPALQRNQRDTQRRQDFADLASAIIASAGDNNGTPVHGGLTASVYVNSTGKDPKGSDYTVNAADLPEDPTKISDPSDGQILVYYGAACNSAGKPAAGTTKQFVVYSKLESGSYCNTFSY